MLVSIAGAHALTPPEAGGFAASTIGSADAGSLAASWGAEENLWIAVAGTGETATTGSYTGLSAGPTNYGSTFLSGITADVVGGVDAGLSFRQLSASSEDSGTWTQDTSNIRWGACEIVVRPAVIATVLQPGFVNFNDPGVL
jgi:hypothetical protein